MLEAGEQGLVVGEQAAQVRVGGLELGVVAAQLLDAGARALEVLLLGHPQHHGGHAEDQERVPAHALVDEHERAAEDAERRVVREQPRQLLAEVGDRVPATRERDHQRQQRHVDDVVGDPGQGADGDHAGAVERERAEGGRGRRAGQRQGAEVEQGGNDARAAGEPDDEDQRLAGDGSERAEEAREHQHDERGGRRLEALEEIEPDRVEDDHASQQRAEQIRLVDDAAGVGDAGDDQGAGGEQDRVGRDPLAAAARPRTRPARPGPRAERSAGAVDVRGRPRPRRARRLRGRLAAGGSAERRGRGCARPAWRRRGPCRRRAGRRRSWCRGRGRRRRRC